MPAEKIHLTLAFLGEIEDSRVGQAALAATRLQAKASAFAIERARFWPHNRIVWVGPEKTPEPLADLAQKLSFALYDEGFAVEKRPFAAHVTLIRKARAPQSLPPPRLQWPVQEFVLVRSAPARDGSRYDVLERYALTPGG